MSNFVSTLFSTPEEFEAWLKNGEHQNKEALDNLTVQREHEWDRKGCLLDVKDGKLQLLCKDRNVLAEIDMCHADGETLIRDMVTGAITVKGIKEKNSGKTFSVWIGTTDAFKSISIKDPTTVYFFTDDTTLDDIVAEMDEIRTEIRNAISNLETGLSMGGIVPSRAEYANKAIADGNGNNIFNSYARKNDLENGTIVPKKATQDSDGNPINTTYAKKTELTQTNDEIAKIKDGTTIVEKAHTATMLSGFNILEEVTGLFSINGFRMVSKSTLYSGTTEINENSKTITLSTRSIHYNKLEIVYKPYYKDYGEMKPYGECVVAFKKYGDSWKRLTPYVIPAGDSSYSSDNELDFLKSITVACNGATGECSITFDKATRVRIDEGLYQETNRFDILQIDGYIE